MDSIPGLGKLPGEGKGHTPVFGPSPWGLELDMTDFHFVYNMDTFVIVYIQFSYPLLFYIF